MSIEAASNAGYHVVSNSDVLSSGIVTVNNLTPDALMIYLQDRMGSIDEQANTAFEKQKQIGEIQKHTAVVQNALAGVAEGGGELKSTPELEASLKELKTLAPELYNQLQGKLGQRTDIAGQPAHREAVGSAGTPDSDGNTDGTSQVIYRDVPEVPEQHFYKIDKDPLAELKTTFQNYSKQQESSASLEMIHLQSIMSARQTAVQLSTNLVSALGKSQESIAANIGH
jgi:hypothetical protein